MGTFRLLDLPPELLVQILGSLNYRDLCRCCSVCKPLHEVITTNTILQYPIELGLSGLTDGPSTAYPISPGDRLTLLRSRRRRWAQLNWSDRIRIPLIGACQAYELVAGVFAKTMHLGRHFSARWLPGTVSKRVKSLDREDLGVETRDFAIDPTQDLIALVQGGVSGPDPSIDIYLRTIETNAPHPETRAPVLRLEDSRTRAVNSFIQIVDDVVGIFLPQAGPRLVIWGWRSGARIVDLGSNDLYATTWDFSFLSNRAYMLTSTRASGCIRIFSFRWPSSCPLPVHHATLHLPRLQAHITPMHLSMHTGPFHAHAPHGSPFTTSPEARVHAVSVQYTVAGTGDSRFLLFFHNHTALSYIRLHDGIQGGFFPENLEWEEWGENGTRFLVHHVPFMWLRYVHGTRVICPPVRLDSPAPGAHMMQLLDFNIAPYSYPHMSISGQEDAHIVREASRIVPGDVFMFEVVSRLPYYTVSRVDRVRYSGYMIDEERIVGLHSTAFSDGDMKHIDVFTF